MLNFFLDFTEMSILILGFLAFIVSCSILGVIIASIVVNPTVRHSIIVLIISLIVTGIVTYPARYFKGYDVSEQEYITGKKTERDEVTLGFAYCKDKNYEGDTCLNYLKYVKDKMKSEAEREKERDKRLEDEYNEAVEKQKRALEIYKNL